MHALNTFIGLEDARLVFWDNKYYAVGVRRDTTTTGHGRQEFSELQINDDSIKIMSPQDRYTYLSFISKADIGLISLSKNLKSHNYPLKMLGYIQLGKPVLASVNNGNEIIPFLHENDIGFASISGDWVGFNHNLKRILSYEQLLTDPEEAADFVSQTHVDALAIAIGTSHGAYKFTRPPTGDTLAIERIKEIHKKIPNTHLVMHGSSSVPQDLLKIINDNGGAIKETYGVPVKEIQEGIKYGVRKINIDTDLRLASTAAIRKHFTNDPAQFDPRKYLVDTKNEMKKIVINRLEEFGTAGNADKIKQISLSIFASKYSSGELSPKIY